VNAAKTLSNFKFNNTIKISNSRDLANINLAKSFAYRAGTRRPR